MADKPNLSETDKKLQASVKSGDYNRLVADLRGLNDNALEGLNPALRQNIIQLMQEKRVDSLMDQLITPGQTTTQAPAPKVIDWNALDNPLALEIPKYNEFWKSAEQALPGMDSELLAVPNVALLNKLTVAQERYEATQLTQKTQTPQSAASSVAIEAPSTSTTERLPETTELGKKFQALRGTISQELDAAAKGAVAALSGMFAAPPEKPEMLETAPAPRKVSPNNPVNPSDALQQQLAGLPKNAMEEIDRSNRAARPDALNKTSAGADSVNRSNTVNGTDLSNHTGDIKLGNFDNLAAYQYTVKNNGSATVQIDAQEATKGTQAVVDGQTNARVINLQGNGKTAINLRGNETITTKLEMDGKDYIGITFKDKAGKENRLFVEDKGDNLTFQKDGKAMSVTELETAQAQTQQVRDKGELKLKARGAAGSVAAAAISDVSNDALVAPAATSTTPAVTQTATR